MIIGPDQKPPPHPFYGDSYERGKDPWHREAFKGLGDEFQNAAPNQSPERSEGWFLIDGCGNAIGWYPDGMEVEVKPNVPRYSNGDPK